jgi:hypothetical protein
MAKDKIEIEVLAKGVKKAEKEVEDLKDEIKDTESSTKKSGTSMISTFTAIGAGAFAAFQTIKKGIDLARDFTRFEQSVKAMESQFGVSADKIIKKLGEVSKGTVSNADLVSAANRAMALNVTHDVDEMAQLMEVARVRGQAMGLDTTQAFEDIVTGIGRGSPLILDNLGIITKGWADEAKAAGQAMDAQFILNKVLADGAEILEKTGDVALTAAEKYQKFEANAKNIALVVGKELQGEFSKLTDSFEGLTGGKSPIEGITRGLRVLIALVRVVALVFTTAARVSALALTPLAVAVGSIIKGLFDAKEAMVALLEAAKNFDLTSPIESLKAMGRSGVDVFKSVGENLIAIPSRIKDGVTTQLELMKGEYIAAGEAVVNIFRDVNTQIGEGEEALTAKQKEELGKRLEAEKEHRKNVAKIYNKSLDAIASNMLDFEKGHKQRLKDTLKATVDIIAQELKARAIAMVALGIATANPLKIAAGTGLFAAVSGIQSLANIGIKGLRQGSDFAPGGTTLVGEAGPELVNLPQGSEVVPNSTVNNESIDNRVNNIYVSSPNAIEFVNDLQQTYGIDVFEG